MLKDGKNNNPLLQAALRERGIFEVSFEDEESSTILHIAAPGE